MFTIVSDKQTTLHDGTISSAFQCAVLIIKL